MLLLTFGVDLHCLDCCCSCCTEFHCTALHNVLLHCLHSVLLFLHNVLHCLHSAFVALPVQCVALYVRHLQAIWAGGQSRFTPSYSQLTLRMVLHTLHCEWALHSSHCTVLFTLCSAQCEHSAVCKVFRECALHSDKGSGRVGIAQYTLHFILCTEHCTVCNLQ